MSAQHENVTLQGDAPTITQSTFGTTATNETVSEFTLRNPGGIEVAILSWGGIVRSLQVPDRHGTRQDIALGFDSLAPYEGRHPYFGTITGRYANRIAHGRFTLDGKTYSLATNNGPNHLHGGVNGFDRKVWKAHTEFNGDAAKLVLTHVSPDGDEGYPGEVSVQVTYTLRRDNSLTIDYRATTTKATPINLTNHTYFNLSGHNSGDVLNHSLQIFGDHIVPVDETSIPVGRLDAVENTAFDFRTPRTIGDRISQVGIGYDHTYVLASSPGTLRRAALASDTKSGRFVEILTTEPGVQLYTGNYLNGSMIGKGGTPYEKHAGFCLETQHFPDSVNQPTFPTTILRPGQVYSSTTVMKFGAL